MTDDERDHLRRAYLQFCVGARLSRHDVARLLEPLGLTNNRLRELGRDSDRALPITPREFHALVSAWVDEQRAAGPGRSR